MLLRFRFSNFRSFRDEQELSMMAGALKDRTDSLVQDDAVPGPILTVAALYGANASGKTNVLRALQFMARAVKFSNTRWQPDEDIEREPFMGQAGRTRPSEFIVDFVLDHVRYQYGLSVDDSVVRSEWLYAYPNGKRQTWFNRVAGKPVEFSEKMPGENKTIEGLTRPNSLFLSASAQNNHAALSPIYRWFAQSVEFVVRDGWPRSSRRLLNLCADPKQKETITKMMASADLGVAGLSVSEEVMPDLWEGKLAEVVETMQNEFKTRQVPFFLDHNRREIQLLHRVGEHVVPFKPDQESNGTAAYLSLLGPIMSSLQKGGVVCIDEIDSSLHPLLAMQFINLFSQPQSNPKGAQLIFNTHDTNLLTGNLLRRDQIWFAEKRPDGASQIYPLSDFKARKEENLANGYLQGRYGAIPFLNSDSLRLSAEADDAKE